MANLTPRDNWDPLVLTKHPLYWPLVADACDFVQSFSDWPDLQDYQDFLDRSAHPVNVRSGNKLVVVPQSTTHATFEEEYEPRIYLKGELQTRAQSWHDFFQILVWKLFPQTKATLNALHYQAIKSRLENSPGSTQRSVLENTLTQYDECGAVIVSPDSELLELVRQFDWHTLFWKQRSVVERNLKCIVFGHAIYEKGVKPYIGLTCHSVLLQVPENIFSSTTGNLIEYIDPLLENRFSNTLVTTPQDLSPFPVLGMPGWHPDNNQETFYHNQNYFRPGRKQKN